MKKFYTQATWPGGKRIYETQFFERKGAADFARWCIERGATHVLYGPLP